MATGSPLRVEVFADVACPFTHVGLRRFVERRAALDRHDVVLWVRSWPLEIVNDAPLDPHFIAEEVDDIRTQVAPDLFTDFREAAFPASSLPALGLAAAAYDRSPEVGERVSLALRDLLFEKGSDIADPQVLGRLAASEELSLGEVDTDRVRRDHAEGVERGVIGSPHFFTSAGGFFCPSLDVGRDDRGHLRIVADPVGFTEFVDACLA